MAVLIVGLLILLFAAGSVWASLRYGEKKPEENLPAAIRQMETALKEAQAEWIVVNKKLDLVISAIDRLERNAPVKRLKTKDGQ